MFGITVLKSQGKVSYLLLRREPSNIKLSSMLAMISDVLSPLRRNSPRVLKLPNVNVLLSHSLITCFSFCSMSLSFTALIQMSYLKWKLSFNHTKVTHHPWIVSSAEVLSSLLLLYASMRRVDSLEKTLMWEGLGAGGEGDNRGWDGWMASPTQWTRVWVNSRSWW